MNAAQIIRLFDSLKQRREPHESVWRECFDNSFPVRGSGLQSSSLTAKQVLDKKAESMDGTATDAGRTLASALQSGMTTASTPWFDYDVNDADDAAKRWLSDAAQQQHKEIHNSNFDSVGFECMLDIVAAGWFAMFIDEDREAGGLHFEAWPISQVYAATTKSGGSVDIVHRSYCLTAEQAYTEFGDACSDQVKDKAIHEPSAEVEMLHAIFPRIQAVEGSKFAKNLPIASVHIEVAQKRVLRESGYEEMPVVVPRWSLIPNSCYAVGPMLDAMPAVRTLNEMIRMDMASADIAIGGMWIAVDDGVLNPRTIKVGARKIIVANSLDSFKELRSGANWQLATERIQSLQAAIRKILLADQLQPQDGPVISATEVHARVALLRQQLGPLFGRMYAEYLQSMVRRSFMISYRAGIFPQPPESLSGKHISIKFINPLAKSQKLEQVSAIQQFNAYLLGFVEAKPDVLDVANFDEQAREMADALNVPMKTVNTIEELKALREARNAQIQAAQAQAQTQNIQTMAADATFKQAAKA